MTRDNDRDLGPIGIVGLGNMGLVLAQRVASEFRVIGTDLSEDRLAEARAAGIEVGALADVTAACSVVLLSLPHPQASLAVGRAIASAPGEVRTVLETSTVTPGDVRALKQSLSGAGIEVLDAAILAGVAQMQAGTAGLVLAGDASTIGELKPLLETITPNRRVLGSTGTAMAAKVINNAVAHVVMVLLAESIALAETAGLDPREIVDILADADGGLMRPLTHRIGERAFTGSYEGGMSLEAARKDSVLVQSMAQDAGVPVFTIPAAHSVYEMAMAHGWARDDYAALVQLWERWCAVSFVQDDGDSA